MDNGFFMDGSLAMRFVSSFASTIVSASDSSSQYTRRHWRTSSHSPGFSSTARQPSTSGMTAFAWDGFAPTFSSNAESSSSSKRPQHCQTQTADNSSTAFDARKSRSDCFSTSGRRLRSSASSTRTTASKHCPRGPDLRAAFTCLLARNGRVCPSVSRSVRDRLFQSTTSRQPSHAPRPVDRFSPSTPCADSVARDRPFLDARP